MAGSGCRRRVIVFVVLVAGATLLAYSLNRRPGDAAFYWLTLSLAAVWALGAVLSGPLHLGSISWRGRNQRPVLTGSAVGLLLGAAFLFGGGGPQHPAAGRADHRVLEYTNYGSLLLIVLIALVNGVAEELFFRGALLHRAGPIPPGADLDAVVRGGDRPAAIRCSVSPRWFWGRCARCSAAPPAVCWPRCSPTWSGV